MGQKVHPIGFRLGINKVWSSRWYPTSQSYSANLAEDIRIRQYIKKRFANAFVADVEIERAGGSLKINIHSSRPSMIIGKKGSVAEALKGEILTKCKVKSGTPSINVFDVKKPDLNAQLVADNIKNQLERRVSFRRAMKKVISQTIKNGAKGIKVNCAGRLGGAEMARKERYMEGRVPLHTLRADVDYARAEAHTTYGIIGIKVWIYRGDILSD